MLPIYYIGLVQAFFAAILVSKKKRLNNADLILIIWLTVIGFEMAYSLLNLTLLPDLPDLIIIPFTYGPFLYFYALSIITDKPFSYKKNWIHFIPFFALTTLAIIWKGGQTITTVDWFNQGVKTYVSFIDYALFIASMSGYWFLVFKKINGYQKNIAHQLSFDNAAVKLNWLKNIAWWILGAFIISGFTYALFLFKNIYPFNPIIFYHLGLLMFIFSISYYGIHQTSVREFDRKARSDKKGDSEYMDAEMESFKKYIESHMKEMKPYLNGELTLHDLAEELNTTDHKISYFLNRYLKRNFFSYINEFRVQEATERIKDSKNKNLTLLSIGYDSGFNSKSSFNSLFKKYTGLTPSEFQKKHSN